jgi:hypothetical protein
MMLSDTIYHEQGNYASLVPQHDHVRVTFYNAEQGKPYMVRVHCWGKTEAATNARVWLDAYHDALGDTNTEGDYADAVVELTAARLAETEIANALAGVGVARGETMSMVTVAIHRLRAAEAEARELRAQADRGAGGVSTD